MIETVEFKHNETSHEQTKTRLAATAVMSFWSWIRSYVFPDNIRERAAQYVVVPFGFIFLPILTVLKLISSNLQVLLDFIWRLLIGVYGIMLKLYDSVEEPRSGSLAGQIFGLAICGLMLYVLCMIGFYIKQKYF